MKGYLIAPVRTSMVATEYCRLTAETRVSIAIPNQVQDQLGFRLLWEAPGVFPGESPLNVRGRIFTVDSNRLRKRSVHEKLKHVAATGSWNVFKPVALLDALVNEVYIRVIWQRRYYAVPSEYFFLVCVNAFGSQIADWISPLHAEGENLPYPFFQPTKP